MGKKSQSQKVIYCDTTYVNIFAMTKLQGQETDQQLRGVGMKGVEGRRMTLQRQKEEGLGDAQTKSFLTCGRNYTDHTCRKTAQNYTLCPNVNFLLQILYSNFVRCIHWGKLREQRLLCTISATSLIFKMYPLGETE